MDARAAIERGDLAGAAAAPPVSRVFLSFLKLGAVAFGGVYGMLTSLERELVGRRRWLTPDELAEAVALGQMMPGPPIVNTGVLVGYRLGGAAGALAATVGQILPGFVVVLLAGVAHAELGSSPLLRGALRGVAAAVVGLLAAAALSIVRRLVDGPRGAAIAVAAFALLAVLHASPIAILAASGLAGSLLFGVRR